ncbi:TM2 domain-containing protein [Maricaulis sp.]|uniref:TM2 domain-containing protein n=1 Tax=Maricaulis sp. TaxID=1486257 RepID=UPI0026233220|nr:TM2 domain-containing protein [Maricaulis sp.]
MNLKSYTLELANIISALPEDNRGAFLTAFQASEKNPVVLYGFNIWLGFLGIDRFLVGDIIAGVLKLITFGGFGIWVIVDYFLIGSRARQKNIELAREMARSFQRRSVAAPAAAVSAPAKADDGVDNGADTADAGDGGE